jgi:SAM-dependent methyltransferase
MKEFTKDDIQEAIKTRYGSIALAQRSGCGCSPVSESSCCATTASAETKSKAMGYSSEDVSSVPEGANLGLGCGNPQAIASLKPGEVVLDLGSGGGFDCFLAARAVGEKGKVIGVDMTPDMIELARKNAQKVGNNNVEFRLGKIENLPVEEASVDVIISNCVINLSPEKPLVFQEAFRVLKNGGRLAVSDIVASAEIPEKVKSDLASYSSCVAGAVSVDILHEILVAAGFVDVEIRPKDESREFIKDWSPEMGVENYAISATIEAVKPKNGGV